MWDFFCYLVENLKTMKKIFILLISVLSLQSFAQVCYHNEVNKQEILISNDSMNYVGFTPQTSGFWGKSVYLNKERFQANNELVYKFVDDHLYLYKNVVPNLRIGKLIKTECTEKQINVYKLLFNIN